MTRHNSLANSPFNSYMMILNMLPQRKSPRAHWIGYNEGMYFITVCTENKTHFFGDIFNGRMHLSEVGFILNHELQTCINHHTHIEIPLYVVMPNHFHAIIHVHTPDCGYSGLPEDVDDRNPNCAEQRCLPLLSTYIASLKSAVTRQARLLNPQFGWQKRYHDHAIRGNEDLNNIAKYIEDNVGKWDSDEYYE